MEANSGKLPAEHRGSAPGPPLPSQPGPTNYPVEPIVPECKPTYVSKSEETLLGLVMLTAKRFRLHTVDQLQTLCGRDVS